ncbi:MAG: DUF1232 domain-containing protein [Candidatus Thermoplasmatota archaeon]|nr:DUF1232 domain-containing protein [Candidatus Thermoplasmatota archaeon]
MLNKVLLGIIIFVVVLVYFLWPVDVIPDFIPVVGWIDDVLVLIGGVVAWWRL